MCCGMRGHERLRGDFRGEMLDEAKRAGDEHERLKALWADVMWFNFEVKARDWQEPWPTTIPDTSLVLHGIRFQLVLRKLQGGTYETCEFPVYYSGPVSDAEAIPVMILWKELEMAAYYEMDCKTSASHVDSYAPGGFDYRELLHTTLVPTDYSRGSRLAVGSASTISRRIAESKDERNGDTSALREAEESDQEAANLLGGVCCY